MPPPTALRGRKALEQVGRQRALPRACRKPGPLRLSLPEAEHGLESRQARHGAQALTFAGAFTAGPGAWAPLVQSGSFLMRSDLVLQLVSRKGTKTVHGEAAAKPSLDLASEHWEAGFRSDPIPLHETHPRAAVSAPPLGLPVYTSIKEPPAFQWSTKPVWRSGTGQQESNSVTKQTRRGSGHHKEPKVVISGCNVMQQREKKYCLAVG